MHLHIPRPMREFRRYWRAGRPSKRSLQRSPKCFIPILDRDLQTRIQSYLWTGKFRKDERVFPITRQAVSANIDRLMGQVGGERSFKVGFHTFRHSFAVHLLLHGRPLKFVSQLLGWSGQAFCDNPVKRLFSTQQRLIRNRSGLCNPV